MAKETISIKKILFIAIAFLSIQIVSSQDTTKVVQDVDSIESKPEFPGGIQEFYKFISGNYKTPISKEFIGGKVYVTFVIEKDGRLTDIKVLRDVGFDTGKEALRVLELSPKWIPAMIYGENVRCSYSLPIVLQAYVFKFSEVEVKPKFSEGMQKFYEYIANNFKTPSVDGLKGIVYVNFIVEKDGSLSRIKVLRDIGYGTGEETIRVLEKCPNWIPAENNGQKVRCLFSLPISFQTGS